MNQILTFDDRLPERIIAFGEPILKALQQMDRIDRKLLVVTKDDQYFGLLSVGDIQRALIANPSLDTPIGNVLRKNLRVARTSDSNEFVKQMMLEFRTELMPVLDEQGNVARVLFWEDVFGISPPNQQQIDCPVVIMAGGKGTRLKPFSNILPKPLFPVGEKTILEVIMDKFQLAGCSRFLLSVNYKADFIRSYFEQLEGEPYSLDYFTEDKPLGTAGSLSLVKDKIQETFFVSNCDIIVETDYSELLEYHREQNNEITLVAALKHFKIPYGTLDTGEGGKLISIREKPELTHMINAGMYVLEPHLLNELPENTFFHITDLIEQIMNRQGRVGVFPVSEKSWSDIGEWAQYKETLNVLSP